MYVVNAPSSYKTLDIGHYHKTLFFVVTIKQKCMHGTNEKTFHKFSGTTKWKIGI